MTCRLLLSCLALPGALMAQVGHAQDSAPALPPGAATPRPTQPERQGPEIDVFRDPVPGTPTSAPTVAPPPVAPTVTPVPVPQPPVQRPIPTTPRQPVRAAPAPVEPQVAPVPAQTSDAAPAATPAPTVPSSQATRPAPAPQSAPPTPANNDSPWGWIAAAVALLLGGVGAWLFLRPARPTAPQNAAPDAEPPPAPPVRPARPDAPSTARAQIAISLEIDAARLTFAGVTIIYRLTLRNRGDARAQDVMVHALLGSADADQHSLLQRFFAGTSGAAVHSVVQIAPGQSHVLDGEIRMAGDAIVPVTISDHPLLIPLIAFDVHYRWGKTDMRSGRTGAAFIVGQDMDPPTARLAPFRMDRGPRPFRRPAVRAAGEPLLA